MLIAWFVFWWVGAFISFATSFLRYKKWYKIALWTLLSWIGVGRELYLINKELKEEEKNYGN